MQIMGICVTVINYYRFMQIIHSVRGLINTLRFIFSSQAFDDFIFAFFAVEMVVKMVALGVFGPKCYLGDTWNRLDLFIVMAG